MPFVDLLQIMDFSLHHAIVRMPKGDLLRQCRGIPMGGPLSPGATIVTCAWMEQEFLHGLHDVDKTYFKTKRYMDDVILVSKEGGCWDHSHFLRALTTDCYMPPLNLEKPDVDNVFLETEFNICGDTITHRLKNDNKDASNPKIWRYQHFNSYAPYARKRAAITNALQKIGFHASDEAQIIGSGIAKMREFIQLGYPYTVLKYCANTIANNNDARAWNVVLRAIRKDLGT